MTFFRNGREALFPNAKALKIDNHEFKRHDYDFILVYYK